MGRCVAVMLMGAGLAIGSAAAASPAALVIQCRGSFYDLGEVTPQRSLYRISPDDVQVWVPSAKAWIGYVCTDRCFTSRTLVSVRDGYMTAKRGHVRHVLTFRPQAGRLSEEWRAGSDVVQFNANCSPTGDPSPGSLALRPSTRADDYTVASVARGLPLPVPRRWYEPQLALVSKSLYRSSTSRP